MYKKTAFQKCLIVHTGYVHTHHQICQPFLGKYGNTLMACLCVLMAALETLADMVDRGNFKDRESQKGYFSIVSPAWFKSGMYEVRRMEDVKGYDYLYASNVHLDNRTCREDGIKAGDIVQIDWINGFEKEPRIDDFVQVYFYSREFSKVEQ